MIVDAYQHILRNVELKAETPAKVTKVRDGDAGARWFAQYAPVLAGLWDKPAAK